MLQRAFGGAIRPISIGRALLAQLDKQANGRATGETITPRYSIALHADDAAKVSTYETALLHELHQAVTRHATIEGYHLDGDVHIDLVIDSEVKRGKCAVNCVSTPSTYLQARDAAIVLTTGHRVALNAKLMSVGRQHDCGIVIDDHNVSRHHADIRRTTSGWVISDRGSTNGVKVNGEKIANGRLLAHGDAIEFGSTVVHFEHS